jgi:hypothetical protein
MGLIKYYETTYEGDRRGISVLPFHPVPRLISRALGCTPTVSSPRTLHKCGADAVYDADP